MSGCYKKNHFEIFVVKHYLLAYIRYFPCYEHGHIIHLVATVTHTKHFNFSLLELIQAIHTCISLHSIPGMKVEFILSITMRLINACYLP